MITLKNISLRRGTKLLLDQASVTLNPGEKVGLVGRNGAGKSSLFALLNRSLQEDSGEFHIPTQWRMGQVAQEMPETSQSATEFVIDGDTALQLARSEVTAAEESNDGERMAHAYMALSDAGEHDAPARLVLFNQIPQRTTTEWVHSTCWLIEENNFAFADECIGDTKPTLLSAGKRPRWIVQLGGHF